MWQRLQERGYGALDLGLWSVSLGAWLLVAFGTGLPLALPDLCGNASTASISRGADRLDLAIRLLDGPGLVGGAALMVGAMMAPTLGGPLRHLWDRSLSRHRWRALLSFGFGYLVTWTGAYALLAATAFGLAALAGSPFSAAAATALAGAAWHFSATRARCLARCHLRPRLSIFGAAALADPLRFGVTLATWCVASCWGLMLPLLCLGDTHLPMAAGSLVIIVERIAPGGTARSGLSSRLAALVARRRRGALDRLSGAGT